MQIQQTVTKCATLSALILLDSEKGNELVFCHHRNYHPCHSVRQPVPVAIFPGRDSDSPNVRESFSQPKNQSETHHPHPFGFFAIAHVGFVLLPSSLNISHDCIAAQWNEFQMEHLSPMGMDMDITEFMVY